MIWYVLGGVAALGLGIYAGLGYPGIPGREDRVVSRRSERSRVRRQFTPLDLLRQEKRERGQPFLSNPPDRSSSRSDRLSSPSDRRG